MAGLLSVTAHRHGLLHSRRNVVGVVAQSIRGSFVAGRGQRRRAGMGASFVGRGEVVGGGQRRRIGTGHDRGAELIGAAEAARDAAGAARQPDEEAWVVETKARLHAGLGVGYDAAVDAGRGLSLTDAISRVAFG